MKTEVFADWSDEALAGIGLRRSGGGVEIDIPEDANIFAMTVGRQLAAGRSAAPAMVFERPDGSLERWSFGEIDRAATALAAHLHLCRTVARRAERLAVELAGAEPINSHAVTYLNRLSDWFFCAARMANDAGRADVLWVPGANR